MNVPEPPLLIDVWHFAQGTHEYVPDRECHSCGEYPSWRVYCSEFLVCHDCFEEIPLRIVADGVGTHFESETVWLDFPLDRGDMDYESAADEVIDHVEVTVEAAMLTVDEDPDATTIAPWAFSEAMTKPTIQHLDIEVGFSSVTVSWKGLCVADILAAPLIEGHFGRQLVLFDHVPNVCIVDE